MTTTMTTNRSPTVLVLPGPGRGARWRWATAGHRPDGARPSGMLTVTRAIARHRHHLRR